MLYDVLQHGLARRVFHQVDATETKLREEVEFWRKLIGKLESQGKEPVLPRMSDALAYTEQKLKAYLATGLPGDLALVITINT
jgi:hypothetical protein